MVLLAAGLLLCTCHGGFWIADWIQLDGRDQGVSLLRACRVLVFAIGRCE